MSNTAQAQSLNAMREQQLMGAEKETMDLRRLMADPTFDPTAPGAMNRILAVAPRSGAQTYQALMAGQREQRQNQVASAELALKNYELSRENLRGIADLPETDRPAAWAAWRAQTIATVPGARGNIPTQYSPAAYATMIAKASEIAASINERPTALAGPGGNPVLVDRRTGTFRMGTEVPGAAAPGAAPAAPAAAPRAEGPAMTPGQTAAADFLRRREGFRDTPYYDVNAYRAGYGSDTMTMADGTVVPVRQGMTVSREDAERDLSRRIPEFERRVVSAVGQDQYAALPPNAQAALISIAYNYGTLPGSIRAAARSGDTAALAQAVAGLVGDNQGVNAGRRREEAAMIAGAAAPNAMAAPGAAMPANAMLVPQDATAAQRPLGIPEFPGLPRAANLSDADLIKRIRDIQSKEAEARMQEDLRRETEAARIQEEGRKAGAIARAQADVRGDKPPPPAGQRYTPDGRLEDIPGSPQARAQTERRTSQVAAANVVTRDIDRILERLNTAVLPVTGMGATTMAALVGGSPAADVAELRKTIEGNISFNKLNELRQQSPTGGALGNVSDKDLELLKTTLGSLNQNQSPRQFRENLLNLRNAFMEVIHGPNFRDVAPPPPEAPAPERLPGQRGAPRPANRPTLEQFLERARPANPNASIEDLTSYYNRTYGGR
jgi:GH24 family phage-related lysozyme (muramidase)